MKRRVFFPVIAAAATLFIGAAWVLADRLEDTDFIPLDHPAINYVEGPNADPVDRLEQRLEKGTVKLDFASNGWGYLPALLKQFDINIDSQVLVFSRTSIQANRISPRTPRAIYFNDDVAVGFVREGELLELTSLDAKQGVKTYVLNTAKTEKPDLARRDDCLQCHQGAVTLGIPGLLVSSVHPITDLTRDMHGSAFVTDGRTEFNQRWGGWYVTGTHGSQVHFGNNTELVDPVHPGNFSKVGTQNVTSLEDKFDTSKYLAPTSDIVALLTLEHQTRMSNLMIRIGWDARIVQQEGKTDAATQEVLNSEIDEMVGYMLFTDEAPLVEPVQGVSTFTKTFPQRGPRDRQGRSLRDFDLKTRIFRYPLSYMIYTAAFDGMPEKVRERVYQRLYDVLTGKERNKPFAKISDADRAAVLDIVRETKKGLPAYWTTPAPKTAAKN